MDPVVLVGGVVALLILLLSVLWISYGSTEDTAAESPKKQRKNKAERRPRSPPAQAMAIPDRFSSVEEIQEALKEAGLESSNLIIGIDFTKSNLTQGKRTFGGMSLHACKTVAGRRLLNPYQQVISLIGKTLEPFDDDGRIPAYGFGDLLTQDHDVFPILDRPCQGVQEVLEAYSQIGSTVTLSGPTNFAPIIRKAMEIVGERRQYHILIIIADGDVTQVQDTKTALQEASYFPLSIICVGVGDGPFHLMEELDDDVQHRAFDNFQFVDFHSIVRDSAVNPEVEFARRALMEIPDQFIAIRKLGLLESTGGW